MCRYESLLDGTLHLEDVADMNDYLDMEVENEFIAQQSARESPPHG
jgi:hypothetical protein